ncbi:MAG: 50S ribosomal protein L10, partial [Nanoarchaeota archaeon]|nr:50S ribosomal protein L10 [Nanoarchaeota archaeon]
MAEKEKPIREKSIPDYKKDLVVEIANKIKSNRTVLVASTKSLPASQFQKIKKSLRGKVEIIVAKKSIILRSISGIEKGALQNLKKQVGADVCLIFSDVGAFELSALLGDNQSAAKAKARDIAPLDINIEAGPTDLIPGPAISELGSVGLKVTVENGKLTIKQGATIVKEGEIIKENVANVMGKLNITPMKVGFIPIAAYDAEDDTVYTEIKIDKEGALQELRESVGKAFGFAVGVYYVVKETVKYFISKAGKEENALEKK